jgi:hypothetical protein
MYIFGTNTSGNSSSVAEIKGQSGISVSASGRAITISNTSGAYVYVLAISYYGQPTFN